MGGDVRSGRYQEQRWSERVRGARRPALSEGSGRRLSIHYRRIDYFSATRDAAILMSPESTQSRIFDLIHLGEAPLGLPAIARLGTQFLLCNVLLAMRFFEPAMELLSDVAKHTVTPKYERRSMIQMRLNPLLPDELLVAQFRTALAQSREFFAETGYTFQDRDERFGNKGGGGPTTWSFPSWI